MVERSQGCRDKSRERCQSNKCPRHSHRLVGFKARPAFKCKEEFGSSCQKEEQCTEDQKVPIQIPIATGDQKMEIGGCTDRTVDRAHSPDPKNETRHRASL